MVRARAVRANMREDDAETMDIPREVVCPKCRSPLAADDPSHVRCVSCGARFPVVDDVIDFLAQPEQNDDRERGHEA